MGWKILLGISVLLNVLLGINWINNKNTERVTAKVAPRENIAIRVIDGDTIEMSNKQIIRLASIDAPEIGMCGGEEAKIYLKELIEGKEVEIKGDLNDQNGRLLALAYIKGALVNNLLLQNGWAEYTSQNSGVNELLKASGAAAREKKVGIFSELCRQTTPPDPKCVIKGNVKDSKKTYFYPGCGNYSNVLLELNHGDQWFCSEQEAVKAGFVKGENCH